MENSSAYLAHIVSQTRQNINFLISQHKISPTDGSDILAKLPSLDDSSPLGLSIETQGLGISPLHVNPNPYSVPTNPEPNGHSHNQPSTVQARALWDYKGQENTTDLTFRAGDIIEIVAEPHRDWWSGRNLKPGFFPSIYVEKITAAVAIASPSSSLSQLSLLSSSSSSPPLHSQHILRNSPPQIDAVTPSPPSHVAPAKSTNGPRPSAVARNTLPLCSQSDRRSLPKTPLSTIGR